MKKMMIVTVIFLMAVIGQIRFLDEYVSTQGELETHINVNNPSDTDLDEMRVRAFVLETGEMFTKNPVDIESGEKEGNFLFWEPTVEPQEYLVRFTVSNDDHKEVKYRYITVY